MTYQEFLCAVLARIRECMEGKAQVSLHTIYKNNRVKKDAVCILEGNCNVSPTIYLETYYEDLKQGLSITQVVDRILEEYKRNRCFVQLDVQEFQDFQRVQSKIVCKLINYEENRELLMDVPHRGFLDLAIVYYFLVENDFLGSGTAVIHHDQMQSWHVTEETLYQTAIANTDRLLGNEVTEMDEVIFQLLKKDMAQQLENNPEQIAEGQIEQWVKEMLYVMIPEKKYHMFVMSNRDKYMGAAAVLNTAKLQEFADTWKGGFYVIPSSIHEVILLPESESVTREELKQLLRELNESAQESQDYLSENVYYFDNGNGCLTM